VWKALPPRDFPNYAAGSWGPKEAAQLLDRNGHRWRRIAWESCERAPGGRGILPQAP
jgi:hypothetical protein